MGIRGDVKGFIVADASQRAAGWVVVTWHDSNRTAGISNGELAGRPPQNGFSLKSAIEPLMNTNGTLMETILWHCSLHSRVSTIRTSECFHQ